MRDQAAFARCLGIEPDAMARDMVARDLRRSGTGRLLHARARHAELLPAAATRSAADIDTYRDGWTRIWDVKETSAIRDLYFHGATGGDPGRRALFGPRRHRSLRHRLSRLVPRRRASRSRARSSTAIPASRSASPCAGRCSGTHAGFGHFGEPTGAPVYVMGLSHALHGRRPRDARVDRHGRGLDLEADLRPPGKQGRRRPGLSRHSTRPAFRHRRNSRTVAMSARQPARRSRSGRLRALSRSARLHPELDGRDLDRPRPRTADASTTRPTCKVHTAYGETYDWDHVVSNSLQKFAAFPNGGGGLGEDVIWESRGPQRLHQLASRHQVRHPYRLLDLRPADREALAVAHRRPLPGRRQQGQRGVAGARRVGGARASRPRPLPDRGGPRRSEPGARHGDDAGAGRRRLRRAHRERRVRGVSGARPRAIERECALVQGVFEEVWNGRLFNRVPAYFDRQIVCQTTRMRRDAGHRSLSDRADRPAGELSRLQGRGARHRRPRRAGGRPARRGDLAAARHLQRRADLRPDHADAGQRARHQPFRGARTARSCASSARRRDRRARADPRRPRRLRKRPDASLEEQPWKTTSRASTPRPTRPTATRASTSRAGPTRSGSAAASGTCATTTLRASRSTPPTGRPTATTTSCATRSRRWWPSPIAAAATTTSSGSGAGDNGFVSAHRVLNNATHLGPWTYGPPTGQELGQSGHGALPGPGQQGRRGMGHPRRVRGAAGSRPRPLRRSPASS